jgi:hypothetical protein
VLLCAFPAFGESEVAVPKIVEDVVRNRDFFTKRWILWGYEDASLLGVNRLNDERIGIDILTPLGFEVKVVYEVATLKVLYAKTLIPRKSEREALRRESLPVRVAVKLARSLTGKVREP